MGKWAATLLLSVLVSGCAFEVRSVGAGNGGLDGDGGAAGLGSGGFGGVGGVVPEFAPCTPGTERTDCPGTSCDPQTMRCSTFKLASRAACWTCVSDNDCESPDHRCVEMYFDGERFPDEKHGFCLQVAAVELELDDGVYELDDEEDSNCSRPLRTVLIKRPSLSGPPTNNYCGIREDLTTCFALRAFENQERCPDGTDDECPTGGICRTFNHQGDTVNCCTFACTDDDQCPDLGQATSRCGGYCGD